MVCLKTILAWFWGKEYGHIDILPWGKWYWNIDMDHDLP